MKFVPTSACFSFYRLNFDIPKFIFKLIFLPYGLFPLCTRPGSIHGKYLFQAVLISARESNGFRISSEDYLIPSLQRTLKR